MSMLTLPAMWSRMSLEPAHLFGGEGASGSLLHGEPALEALAHRILEGGELGGLADGVAH